MHNGNQSIEVGSRVAYKAQFLRDTGDYSHARSSLRGTVMGVNDGLVTVKWSGVNGYRNVWIGNLVPADHIHLE